MAGLQRKTSSSSSSLNINWSPFSALRSYLSPDADTNPSTPAALGKKHQLKLSPKTIQLSTIQHEEMRTQILSNLSFALSLSTHQHSAIVTTSTAIHAVVTSYYPFGVNQGDVKGFSKVLEIPLVGKGMVTKGMEMGEALWVMLQESEVMVERLIAELDGVGKEKKVESIGKEEQKGKEGKEKGVQVNEEVEAGMRERGGSDGESEEVKEVVASNNGWEDDYSLALTARFDER